MKFDPQSPDPDLIYNVGLSGGKDSVAAWLHLTQNLRLPNVVCTFSNTSWESIHTLFYLAMLRDSHSLPLVFVQPLVEDLKGELRPHKMLCRLRPEVAARWYVTESNKYGPHEQQVFWNMVRRIPLTMERLAIVKRRFPSTTVRFCTTFLKLMPQARWIQAHPERHRMIRVSGIRSEESEARARRPAFVERDEVMEVPLWAPIKEWMHDEVFAIHHQFGVPVNPLYTHGMGRVGCWPCIMARKQELASVADRFPEAFIALGDVEARVADATGKPAMSFFSNTKTPSQFHSQVCSQSQKSFPVADDVRRWAAGEEPFNSGQAFLPFEDDHTEDFYACTSQYGLCE